MFYKKENCNLSVTMSKESYSKKWYQTKIAKAFFHLIIYLIVINVAFLCLYYFYLNKNFPDRFNFLNLGRLYNWLWLEGSFLCLYLAYKLRKILYLAIFLLVVGVVVIIVFTILNL